LLCPYRGAIFHSISITNTNFGGWAKERNQTQLFDRQLAQSLAAITDTPPAEAGRFDDTLPTALAAIESRKICLRLWFNRSVVLLLKTLLCTEYKFEVAGVANSHI